MITGKIAKGLPPLRRSTLSKKSQDKEDENKNYMRLISGLSIGYYNYIVPSLNGLIQQVKPKGINRFPFPRKQLRK